MTLKRQMLKRNVTLTFLSKIMNLKVLLFLILLEKLFKCDIVIKEEGVGYVNEDDIALIFYVTVENTSKQDYYISVRLQQCCEDLVSEQDCNHMFLIGGDMGLLHSKRTKNVTLIYPNMYLTNRKGVCTVAVKYRTEFLEKEIAREIRFDTSQLCAALENKDIQPCESPDLDPFAGCTPVDCLLKYSGEKSYFNPTTKLCQCVSSCLNRENDCEMPDTAYSPYSNRCIDLKRPVTAEDLVAIEENQVENTCTPNLGNIVCHHGTVDNDGSCECNNGWLTSTEEEAIYEPMLGLYHMCNVEVGPWGCVNKHRLKTTILLIAIFGLTIISKLLILMCILNWCIKHLRKNRDRTCTDKFNPEDETLIMCEDLSVYDEKCICSDPQKKEEQTNENLKMETVNVAYFPCCPSNFSSIRASTGSGKSKFSMKTDQSIDLSKTTSDSYTISFRSEEMSEQSEEPIVENEEEEENYEIEFTEDEEEECVEEIQENCDCIEEVEQDFSFISEEEEELVIEEEESENKSQRHKSSSSKGSKKTQGSK